MAAPRFGFSYLARPPFLSPTLLLDLRGLVFLRFHPASFTSFPLSFSLHRLGCLMAVGVLALQGSFNEHITALRRIGVNGVEIRKPEQLKNVDALIIPGGESTTMAKLADHHNLFPAMREFVSTGKPVWGTCAGLILLANKAVGQKLGGQEFIGGLDCTVHRNFFGSQLQSFETLLSVPKLAEKEGGPDSCRGVFIRAPAILEAGPDVEILADCPVPSDNARTIVPGDEGKKERVIVAVRQGNLLGTAFHPELTSDPRWHRFFIKMGKETGEGSLECMSAPEMCLEDCPGKRPYDLPIFQ